MLARSAVCFTSWNMITKGLSSSSFCCRSLYICSRFAISRSSTAAAVILLISGISQELRQASGFVAGLSELRAKLSALVCGSM